MPGGMMPWRQLRLGCHPPGLFDRLKQLPGFNPREMLDMELEVKAIDGCPEDEYAEFSSFTFAASSAGRRSLRHLIESEPADLVAVMFDGVDKLQHLCWRFIDPACRPRRPNAWEQEMIERCERYFRVAGRADRRARRARGPEATVVLASDHGFGPTQDVFHVNSWLEQHGYLAWAPGSAQTARSDTDVGFAEMTRHVHALDWSRTRRLRGDAVEPGDSHRRARSRQRATGCPRSVAREARAEIAEALRELSAAPHDGQPLVEEVWTREQAFAGPFEELGPDLSLVLADGGTMSILPSRDDRRAAPAAARPSPVGGHLPRRRSRHPRRGVRRGAVDRRRGAAAAASARPAGAGRHVRAAPEAVFEPGELERRPVGTSPRRRPRRWPTSRPASTSSSTPEEQATLMERLRALGYVE